MDFLKNIFGESFEFGANQSTFLIVLVIAIVIIGIYCIKNKDKVTEFFKSTFGGKGSKKDKNKRIASSEPSSDVFVVYSPGCSHCTNLHKSCGGIVNGSGQYETPELGFLKWIDSQHNDLGKLLAKAEIKEEEIPGVPFIFKIPKSIYNGDRSPESLIAFSKE